MLSSLMRFSKIALILLLSACPSAIGNAEITPPGITSALGLHIHGGEKNRCDVSEINRWERELIDIWMKEKICKTDPAKALAGKDLFCEDTPKVKAPDGRILNGWATNLRAAISFDGRKARTKSLFFHEISHIIAYYCDEDVDHYLFRLLKIDACGRSCK